MRAKLARYASLCCRTARNIYLVAGKTRHGRLIERDFLGGIALLARICMIGRWPIRVRKF
jgi:hypothetical protein